MRFVGLLAITSMFLACAASADSGSQANALSVMTGKFVGKVHLAQSNQDFDAVLNLMIDVVPSSGNSSDPSQVILHQVLAGNMSFPALINASIENYSKFTQLLDPLDDLAIAQISAGFYQADAKQFVLPYLGSDGKVIGNFSGQISGNELTGTWSSIDLGPVGTFDLIKQ